MTPSDAQDVFSTRQRFLFSLAYRMLGTRADAEDAVQETFLKWRATDRGAIDNPAAWLTQTCTNLCVDMLRAAYRTRVEYVGSWLPEPIHARLDDTPESRLELASSLTTAFLLMLERLTPKERAAYLLHEIFDTPYPDIAATLGMQESACRKLVSRAREAVETDKVRHVTPVARQQELLGAFRAAIDGAGTERLAALLADDVCILSDSGGKASALRHELLGKQAVLRFIERGLQRFWHGMEWVEADINNTRGVLLREGRTATAAMTFAYDEKGSVSAIYVMRNPDKLGRV
ncbi:ECF RNA polymerase sigma factor SigJ [Pigmentiphaga humi]|uniref:ECF RNA polymerase sigma factor SigJ n=1 Tax=Pigmentiphaga humi TaxID=2478468 RepID=A0A3P4B0V4_9BURK|nr:RNA polymerase sigma factor SigJ [Pigmentiphaga humi]VCU68755.1 ECF RNA polymerase sigma factor SigJ [Pigmentiphaga humi]